MFINCNHPTDLKIKYWYLHYILGGTSRTIDHVLEQKKKLLENQAAISNT